MRSAVPSPACGRASGRFSTLTARAGRSGTDPLLGATPVSGQIGGGVGDGLDPGDPSPGPLVRVVFACPASVENPNTIPPTTTTIVVTVTAKRPRFVKAMSGFFLHRGGVTSRAWMLP